MIILRLNGVAKMIELKKMSRINAEISVPGDKSISHRAVMLGALADGDTVIHGFLNGADCLSTIDCFRNLGIETEFNNGTAIVHGKGLYGLKKPSVTLYTGNSGTTTRLLCGILAAQDFDSSITGDASICKRPMKRVNIPLSMMGANIEGDFCPLLIHGRKLKAIEYTMPVASAQVKTAILLAGLFAEGTTRIIEPEKSRDHTERMLEAMGADMTYDSHSITLTPGKNLKALEIEVPGDISSAAFFIAAASIMKNSRVVIKNVGINPTRTGILDAAIAMGADIKLENERISNNEPICDIIVKSAKLHAAHINGALIPRLIDEIPVLAVMAVCAEGETVIADAAELKVKESDRLLAIYSELVKCGADITMTDDGLIIRGGKPLHGADFKSWGDHRMAMSLAVLAQVTSSPCRIDDVDCVNISYPGFFDDFYGLEAK